MPKYQTRHLEATREFMLGRRPVRAGDRFEAAPIDADYYVSRRMATEVAPTPAAAEKSKPAARRAASAPGAGQAAAAPAPAPAPKPPSAPAGVTTLADLDPARASEAKPGAAKADDQ